MRKQTSKVYETKNIRKQFFLPVNNSSSKELPGDCRAATRQKTDKKSERLPLVLLQKISF